MCDNLVSIKIYHICTCHLLLSNISLSTSALGETIVPTTGSECTVKKMQVLYGQHFVASKIFEFVKFLFQSLLVFSLAKYLCHTAYKGVATRKSVYKVLGFNRDL